MNVSNDLGNVRPKGMSDLGNIRPRAYSTGSMAEILRQRRQFAPICLTPRRSPCAMTFRPGRSALSSDERRHPSDVTDSLPSTPDLRPPSRSDVPRIRVNTPQNHPRNTPDVSPIITRRQRINSLPAESVVPANRDYADTLLFYRRFSILAKFNSVLGSSLRSLTRDRQSSICSTVTNIDDDIVGPGEQYGMFNISPASSMYIPTMRLAVHSTVKGPDRLSLISDLVALGDTEDNDDVFTEDAASPNGKRSVCLKLGTEEYLLTFMDGECIQKKLPDEDLVDGHLVLFDPQVLESVDSAKETIVNLITGFSGPNLPVIAVANPCLNTEKCADFSRFRVPVVALESQLPHHLLGMIEDVLYHVKPALHDSNHSSHRRLRSTFSTGDAVDKQTLFNRFFWRPLPTKSCENLLAL